MTDLTLVYAQAPGAGHQADAATPLGCLSIAATLQQHGFDVDFRDYQLTDLEEPRSPETFAAFLTDPAEIVAVGCMVDFLPVVLLALEAFKKSHPDRIVILGGPGPSDIPAGLLEAFPSIDIVVVGEGEETMVELLHTLLGRERDLSTVAGIVYRNHGDVVSNAPRCRIEELDRLPFPQPAAVDVARYKNVHVMTSRGCPFECTFCDVSQLWQRHTTYRGIDNVIAELQALHRMGFRQVAFQDDNFTVHRKRLRALVERLGTEDEIPAWSCLGRVDLVTEDLLRDMAQAGCRGIFFGVESGSDRVLQQIMKKTTAAIARRAVEAALRYFPVKAYFIWGFPGETLQDLVQTLLLMSYFQGLGAVTPLTLLAPLPRSVLYAEQRETLRLDPRLFAYNFVSGFTFGQSDRRVLDLVRAHPRLFPSFYTFATPDAEAKCRLVERFKPLNDLGMSRPERAVA
jgi:anaerobic magnesium-protoporphyrin IX monomethyl ester cyclase